MEPPVIAAVVSSVFTAIVAPIAKRYIEELPIPTIPGSRRRDIRGRWEGVAIQEWNTPTELSFQVLLNLEVAGKHIKGNMDAKGVIPATEDTGSRPFSASYRVNGMMLRDQFVKLDYFNKDNNAVHFGSVILQLSADGQALRGRFLGYGSFQEKIIAGNIKLRKAV